MGRIKIGHRSESKACYEKFCATHPNIHITFPQYRNIIRTYNQMIRDHVLETGDKVKLPFGFGEVSVRKWKKKKTVIDPNTGEKHIAMAVDWAKFNKEGKFSYHLNTHTDGFRFQWKWFKETARFEASKLFVFKPARETSRKLAAYIKKNETHYHRYREWGKRSK